MRRESLSLWLDRKVFDATFGAKCRYVPGIRACRVGRGGAGVDSHNLATETGQTSCGKGQGALNLLLRLIPVLADKGCHMAVVASKDVVITL